MADSPLASCLSILPARNCAPPKFSPKKLNLSGYAVGVLSLTSQSFSPNSTIQPPPMAESSIQAMSPPTLQPFSPFPQAIAPTCAWPPSISIGPTTTAPEKLSIIARLKLWSRVTAFRITSGVAHHEIENLQSAFTARLHADGSRRGCRPRHARHGSRCLPDCLQCAHLQRPHQLCRSRPP